MSDGLYGFLPATLRPRGFCDADIDRVIGGVEQAVMREIARQRRGLREQVLTPGGT